jgi:hypothetical protein
MIVIRDPNELSKINDTALREFIRQYFLSLCEPEDYDPMNTASLSSLNLVKVLSRWKPERVIRCW